MSSGILSRWPIRLSLPVDAGDRDREQHLTEQAIDRLFRVARSAYFELCTTVDESMLEVAGQTTTPGVPVTTETVTISVGVVEVYPDAFTMEARIRPGEGEGVAAQARCRLAMQAGVTDAMRDEFIALAHAARYTH